MLTFTRHPDNISKQVPRLKQKPFPVSERPSRKLVVILHADVVSSTALVQRDEALAHERIQDGFLRLSNTIEAYGGNAHELRGDAVLAEIVHGISSRGSGSRLRRGLSKRHRKKAEELGTGEDALAGTAEVRVCHHAFPRIVKNDKALIEKRLVASKYLWTSPRLECR